MAEPRILGVTLARGGSKAVPRKNIRPVAGHPLIAYTIVEGLRSGRLTRFIVSSDDDEIRQVAQAYGAEAPFRRPPEISDDKATSEATLRHAVLWAEEDEGQKYDYVVELMATGPLKAADDISGAIDKLIATGADSVIAVAVVEDHHPARLKKIENDRLVDFCVPEPIGNRRQDLRPLAYIRCSSIYAMRRDVLVEQHRRYGTADSRPYILPPERAASVDSEIDLMVIEELLRRQPRPYVQPIDQRVAP